MARQIPIESLQQAGPEGSSLWCGKCGTFEYITPVHNKEGISATCNMCKARYAWSPRVVTCAAPSHNGPGDCSNENCFKSANWRER